MADTIELIGFLSEAAGSPKELLTDELLSTLEPIGSADTIGYRTNPDAEYSELDFEELRSVLEDESLLQIKKFQIYGNKSVKCDYLDLATHHYQQDLNERAPLIHATLHEGLLVSNAHQKAETVVSFVETLARELPITYLKLYILYEPFHPKDMPRRDASLSQVLGDVAFLSVLGPEMAAQLDEERLATAPAYEVRQLENGSALIRLTELPSEVNEASGTSWQEIRQHLGIE